MPVVSVSYTHLVLFNCIYGGEDYDARREQKGWNMFGFKEQDGRPVVIQEAPKGLLRPQIAQPVKIMAVSYTQLDVYKRQIIESMNCKNLSEAYLWKSRMASILGKVAFSESPA